MMHIRKTKIVCTLGPASNSYETVKKLAEAGMDVARFNFSHGDHQEHLCRVEIVKRLRAETGRPIALLADTKGPADRYKTVSNLTASNAKTPRNGAFACLPRD